VDLQYEAATSRTGEELVHGKPASAIFGDPDVPCLLLLNDPANEQLLPVGLGAYRILTPEWIFNAGYRLLEKHQGKSDYSPPKAGSVLGLFLGCAFTWNCCKSARSQQFPQA